jgi:uncharacterized membrane protein YgcG
MTDRLEQDLKEKFEEIPEPESRRDRAMFTAGVAARRQPPVWRRALVPTTAIFVVLLALSISSLRAAPGQVLYPVRNALNSVGLAGQPVEVVDRVIRRGEVRLERADERLDNGDFSGAEALVRESLQQFGEARALLNELHGEPREERAEEIADLEDEAYDVLEDIDEERAEAAADARARDDNDDDDSSGPGSGDSDDNDDSSGPGSGDSDDDNSGSGSGGSGSDDDNSGSGSGDDNSGSGSGGSGSGSGESGSGGSGSGGSGSGGSGGSGSDD